MASMVQRHLQQWSDMAHSGGQWWWTCQRLRNRAVASAMGLGSRFCALGREWGALGGRTRTLTDALSITVYMIGMFLGRYSMYTTHMNLSLIHI